LPSTVLPHTTTGAVPHAAAGHRQVLAPLVRPRALGGAFDAALPRVSWPVDGLIPAPRGFYKMDFSYCVGLNIC
jgi:hypothetical protein